MRFHMPPVILLISRLLLCCPALSLFAQGGDWSSGSGTSVEHLGPDVNSVFEEYYPLISPDGKTLYFARNHHPQNIGSEDASDIWVSYLQDDYFWSKPVNLGPPVNNTYTNIPVGISLDGETLYLSGNYYGGDPYNGISQSRKTGRFWSEPEAMVIRNFLNRDHMATFHVSSDGNFLLMSVRLEENYGDRDLYVSFRESADTWSAPKNLGPRVNSLDTETGAFLAADNETLYFYSNGHDTHEKKFQLYKTSRLDDSWSRWSDIMPLDPFTSPDCDNCFASITADANGFFFSHRQQANANEDLLKLFALPREYLPAPLVQVQGQVVSPVNGSPLSARLKAQSLVGNTYNSSSFTNAQGQFRYMLPYGHHIGIFAEAEGYFIPGKYAPLNPDDLQPLDYDNNLLAEQPERILLQRKYDHSETETLQLLIDSLDREIALLDREREKFKFLPLPSVYAPQAPVSTSELERLRAKYYKMAAPSGGIVGGEKTTTPADKPASAQSPPGKSTTTSNDELARLKSKYGAYYGVEPTATAVAKPPVQDTADLALYKKLLKMELSQEWASQIKVELREQYMDDVAKELEKDLDEKSRKMLNKTVKEQAKNQLRYQGLAQVRQEDEDSNPVPKNAASLSPFEEELRNLLRQEVKEQLLGSLEEPVRNEIAIELKYILNKQIRDQYRAALQTHIQSQLKEESEVVQVAAQAIPPDQLPQQRSQPFLAENKHILVVLDAYPLKPGQIIPLHDVFFDFNSSRLRPESYPELQRIVRLMQRYPALVIEINAHTNGRCSHQFANTLTSERARNAAEYLASKGITSARVRHNGFGKTAPIRSNDTEEGRTANQRLEMKIISGI